MSASLYDELPDAPIVDNTYSNFPNQQLPPSNKKDEYSVYQMPNEEYYVSPLVNRPISTDITDETMVYQMPSGDVRRDSTTYFNIPESPGTATYTNMSGEPIGSVTVESTKSNEYYTNRYDYSDSFSDATSTSFTDTVGSSLNSFNQLSLSSSESGDLKLPSQSTSHPLRMTQDEAISKYRQYQTETVSSCNKVIEFAKAKWKSEEMLKLTIKSIKSSIVDLFQNLLNLHNFSTSILENSKLSGDLDLTKKIWKHLQPLQEAILNTKESIEKLDSMNWSPEKIAISVRLAVREGADSLSLVVSASRNVLIHIRSLSVTIVGNGNVLFPDSSTYAIFKPNDNHLLIPTQSKLLEDESSTDKANLLEIMRLFGQQMKSQTEHVNETVNDFIKIFPPQSQSNPSKDTVISHSKFVVRSATQLVCMAKNLTDAQMKTIPNQKIEQEGNNLCDLLKIMVNATKELLTSTDSCGGNFDNLIVLLKSVKTNARTLQSIVVESVAL